MTYHAMASSAVFASHVNKGLTTPGLKKVPMPGYKAYQQCPGCDRKFNRGRRQMSNGPGSKQSVREDNTCPVDRRI